MKKFTINDFYNYNNPCFSCSFKTTINYIVKQSQFLEDTFNINPIIYKNKSIINIASSYYYKDTLTIHHKDNSFITSNKNHDLKFLNSLELCVSSFCINCGTVIDSDTLLFKNNYILPFFIKNEYIVISDDSNKYFLHTHKNQSNLEIIDQKSNNIIFDVIFPSTLYLSDFKNKQHFLSKMKTYLLFS